MTEPLLALPEACSKALAAVQDDPLDPGPDAEVHLRACRACSEARVAFLAQEEFPEPLAPGGYFERLPDRTLRKLPARIALPSHTRRFYWATAAALLLTVGATAFWVGRANRAPLVEATLPHAPSEILESPEMPFLEADDSLSQLTTLSQEDANAVLRTVAAPPPAAK